MAMRSLLADWSYDSQASWGDDCGGSAQSPVDLGFGQFKPALERLLFSSGSLPTGGMLTNNGHSVTYSNTGNGWTLSGGAFGNNTYELEQFHFHWGTSNADGSEHIVLDNAFPLEVHMVHRNTDFATISEALASADGLAVVGVFFEEGNANTELDKVFSRLDQVLYPDNTTSVDVALDVLTMLGVDPAQDDFFSYSGSLTTPPCSEAVSWVVMRNHATLSSEQLALIHALQDSHDMSYANFREVQPLNGRVVHRSWPDSDDEAYKSKLLEDCRESCKTATCTTASGESMPCPSSNPRLDVDDNSFKCNCTYARSAGVRDVGVNVWLAVVVSVSAVVSLLA